MLRFNRVSLVQPLQVGTDEDVEKLTMHTTTA